MIASLNNFSANSPVIQVPRCSAPWHSHVEAYDLSLTKYNRNMESFNVILPEFLELESRYGQYTHFRTDSSKTVSHVGSSMVGPTASVLRIGEGASAI